MLGRLPTLGAVDGAGRRVATALVAWVLVWSSGRCNTVGGRGQARDAPAGTNL